MLYLTALLAIFFNENLYNNHFIGGITIVIGLLISKSATSKSSKALSYDNF